MIAVLFGDFIKTAEVHAKAQRPVLLFCKENRRTVRGSGLTDKSRPQILVQEVAKGLKFPFGQGVHPADRGLSTFVEIDLEVIRAVECQITGARLAEDVLEFVEFFRDDI